MSATTFLCLIAGLAVVWSSLWVYMLNSVLSDDLEQVKKKLTKLEAEFARYNRRTIEEENKEDKTE